MERFKLGMSPVRRFTIHEIRQEDVCACPLRILVGQDTVVGQHPTKSVWNDNDHAGWVTTVWGVGNVAVQAVHLLDAPCWNACVQRAGGTTRLETHSRWQERKGWE